MSLRTLFAFPKIKSCAVLIGTFAVLVGCSGAPKAPVVPKPDPLILEISVTASSRVNPDLRGRPSPIVVRVFELKSKNGFEGADFFALNDKEQATLGGDVVMRDELFLQPGQTHVIKRQANENTKLIGVYAAYRDLERTRWRETMSLSPQTESFGKGLQTRSVSVLVDEKNLSIR